MGPLSTDTPSLFTSPTSQPKTHSPSRYSWWIFNFCREMRLSWPNACPISLQTHSNETIGSIRWKIAEHLSCPVDNVQIFANDSVVGVILCARSAISLLHGRVCLTFFSVPVSWQWIETRSCSPSSASVTSRAWLWRAPALELLQAVPSPLHRPLAVPAQPSSTQPTPWSRYYMHTWTCSNCRYTEENITSDALQLYSLVSRRSPSLGWWWLWCAMCLRCFISWLTLMSPGEITRITRIIINSRTPICSFPNLLSLLNRLFQTNMQQLKVISSNNK